MRVLVIGMVGGVVWLLVRGLWISALVWIAMCLAVDYMMRRNK